jgi:hypothetical protein
MSEQLIFGLDELQNLKRLISMWNSRFNSADIATVVLVTIAAGLVYFAIFCILGGPREIHRAGGSRHSGSR